MKKDRNNILEKVQGMRSWKELEARISNVLSVAR
jgi:hypothetical protein